MKRVENSDINIKLPSGLVYINNFDAKFYTVNAKSFYITKTQNDVYPIEHDDVIEYYIKLEWDELITIGEGVLQYQIVNNIPDYDRADGYYNKAFARTTEYYINSNVTVDEEEAESYAEIIAELGDKIDGEIARSTSADTLQTEALNSEIQIRQDQIINEVTNRENADSELSNKINAKLDISAYTPTDLSNYYTKSEVYNKTEIDNKGYLTEHQDISGKLNISDFNVYSADTKTIIDSKVDSTDLDDFASKEFVSGFTYNKTATDELLSAKLDTTAYTPTDLSNYYTKSETSGATEISTALKTKLDAVRVEPKTPTSNYTQLNLYLEKNGSGSQSLFTYVKTINGKSITTQNNDNLEGFSLIETSAITTSINSSSTDAQVPSAKAVYDAIQEGGGGSTYTAGRGISIANDVISFSLPISATTNDNLIIGDKSNGVNDPYNSGKSIVFGRYSTVKAYDSLVGGYNCSNEKGQSQAFGNYTKTKNLIEFGCGKYNNSVSGSSTFGDSGNTLFSVGNGTADNARHNAFEIRQNGDIYLTKDGQDVKLQDQLGGGGSDINVVQTTGTSTTDVMSQDAVTTQLNNKANKSAAVGGYRFGTTNDVGYLQYRNVNNDNIDNSIYYPKINGKSILTSNNFYAENNYNFQLVETSAITTSISSGSTDAQVPSAKAVNDKLGGLSFVILTQSEYDNLTTYDNNKVYIIK